MTLSKVSKVFCYSSSYLMKHFEILIYPLDGSSIEFKALGISCTHIGSKAAI